ncbi:MAG TPA: amino acid permease, partial [Syntrophobacteraceae bacterium]|nr:amino acid permease [Syntrophobacteraceae bacterium]
MPTKVGIQKPESARKGSLNSGTAQRPNILKKLTVSKTELKGWGLFTLGDLTTVCEAENLRKPVTLLSATLLVIANMIGTGVFTTLGLQLAGINSVPSVLLLWIAGGAIAFLGALAYGELGAMMPRSGGEYAYLSKIYHPAAGFLSGCASIVAGFGAPIALSAIAL